MGGWYGHDQRKSQLYNAMRYPPHLRQQHSSDFCALRVDLNYMCRAVLVIPTPMWRCLMPGKRGSCHGSAGTQRYHGIHIVKRARCGILDTWQIRGSRPSALDADVLHHRYCIPPHRNRYERSLTTKTLRTYRRRSRRNLHSPFALLLQLPVAMEQHVEARCQA